MGYGDEIMATAELARLQAANPGARIVIGDGAREITAGCDAIFTGNPYRARLAAVRAGERVVWLRNYYGRRPYLDYRRSRGGIFQVFVPYRATPGELYLSRSERAGAAAFVAPLLSLGRPLVSVEPNVAFGPNKDWGFTKWQAVVDALHSRVTFVQPSYGAPLLNGVHAVPATFREFCAVQAHCAAHVGPEGGLHHAAAALGVAAVVVFGGRIDPQVTGYDFHLNLYVDLPPSPCGMVAPCAHCRRCLDSIPVARVVAGLADLLAPRAAQQPPVTGLPTPAPPAAWRAGSTARSPRC